MNKNESKYFNTAVKMDNALIKILEQKEFEYITVKEVCNVAGVNRSTFYLHYNNTVDLLEETATYIIDKFFAYFPVDPKEKVRQYNDCDINELIFISPEYILPYLTFIKENQSLFKTSMKHLTAMGFGNVFNELFKNVFNPALNRFGFPEKDRVFIIKFYLTGVTAIVMEWIKNDCSEPVEDICRIIMECVLGKAK